MAKRRKQDDSSIDDILRTIPVPIPGNCSGILMVSEDARIAAQWGAFHKIILEIAAVMPRWVKPKTIHRLLGIHPADLKWARAQGLLLEGKHFKIFSRNQHRLMYDPVAISKIYPLLRAKMMVNR